MALEVDAEGLPEPIKREWLKRLRTERGVSQKSLSRETGVKQSLISAAETGDRGLSAKSAERVAEELDVCPVGLYVGSQALAAVKAANRDELDPGDALAKLTKLRGRLARLHTEGNLPDTEELDDAVDLLFEAIDGLEEVMEEEGPSRPHKSRALDALDDGDDGLYERDALGRRVNKDTDPDDGPVSRDGFGRRVEDSEDFEDFEDFEDADDGRDAHGRKLNKDL